MIFLLYNFLELVSLNNPSNFLLRFVFQYNCLGYEFLYINDVYTICSRGIDHFS